MTYVYTYGHKVASFAAFNVGFRERLCLNCAPIYRLSYRYPAEPSDALPLPSAISIMLHGPSMPGAYRNAFNSHICVRAFQWFTRLRVPHH
jgi:hypothetical protein